MLWCCDWTNCLDNCFTKFVLWIERQWNVNLLAGVQLWVACQGLGPPSRAQRIYICRYVVSKCICKISLNTYRFGQSWTELDRVGLTLWPFSTALKVFKKRNCLKFEFPIRWSFRETCRTKTTQVQTGKIAYRQEKTPEENIYNKCSKKLQYTS